MAISDADLWHQVHAEREDGIAAMFLIRDVEPRVDQPQILVVQLPYAVTDLSRLPDAAGYRKLDAFQDQWIEPACEALGWTFVASKSEDGSFFFYLYGDGDPNPVREKLLPFDTTLGFFHDQDAAWSEYAALRELVEQSEAAPDDDDDDTAGHGHVHSDDCDHEHEAPAKLRSGRTRAATVSERPARAEPAGQATRPGHAAAPAARKAKTAARTAVKRPTKPARAATSPGKATATSNKSARGKTAKAAPAKRAKAAPAKTAPAKAAPAKAKKPRPAGRQRLARR